MRRVEPNSLRDRVDIRIATELDRRLVDRLAAGSGRSRRVARAGAFLLATGVHVATIGLLALGFALLVLGDNWVQRLMAVLVLLPPAALLLPRRSEETLDQVDASAAPEFTALLGELAGALDCAAPTYVAIDADINAS